MEENKKNNNSLVLKIMIYFWMFIGVFAVFGGLRSRGLIKVAPGELFDIILNPLVFFFIPLLVLKYALKQNINIKLIAFIIIFAVSVSVVGEFARTYNYFIQVEENLDKKIDDIALIYERKLAVLPSISTRGETYNKYEQSILNRIVEGRTKIIAAKTGSEKIEALSSIDTLAKQISLSVENYPNLKSDQFYIAFIEALKAIEEEANRIKNSYNQEVNIYNRYSKIFPYVFVARAMDIKQKQYFTKKEE